MKNLRQIFTSNEKALLPLIFAFLLIVGVILLGGLLLARKYRAQRLQNQEFQSLAPSKAIKRQIRKIRLKKLNHLGEFEFIELTASGLIINMTLIII